MVARHAFVMKPKEASPVAQGWQGVIEPPQEVVQLRAYEKYEERGCANGSDWADWFEAEVELRTLFATVRWVAKWQRGNPPYLALEANGPDHVLKELCRYFRTRPESMTRVGDQVAPFRVIWPEDEVPLRTQMTTPEPTPTAVEIARVRAARSPLAMLSPEEMDALRGCLVALLLGGNEKGKVIASAPLDYDNPERPRRQIRDQVASSPYKNCRYQIRQVLDTATAD